MGYDLTLLSILLFLLIGPFLAAGYRVRQEFSATIGYRANEGYVYGAISSAVLCLGLILVQYLYLLSADAILDRWLPGLFLRLPAWWYVYAARETVLEGLGLSRLSEFHAVAWCIVGTLLHLGVLAAWHIIDLPMHRAQRTRVAQHLKSRSLES